MERMQVHSSPEACNLGTSSLRAYIAKILYLFPTHMELSVSSEISFC